MLETIFVNAINLVFLLFILDTVANLLLDIDLLAYLKTWIDVLMVTLTKGKKDEDKK